MCRALLTYSEQKLTDVPPSAVFLANTRFRSTSAWWSNGLQIHHSFLDSAGLSSRKGGAQGARKDGAKQQASISFQSKVQTVIKKRTGLPHVGGRKQRCWERRSEN